MGQSLSKVYVHITFSTKHRAMLIDEDIEINLYQYIGGICKGIKCNPLQIGGYRNHIHILCTLSKNITQAKLLEEIKKRSSKWIKTQGTQYKHFYWQDGYGIFSVNPKETDIVINYIKHQKERHRKISFEAEFRSFLKKYGVDYDEKYVWD